MYNDEFFPIKGFMKICNRCGIQQPLENYSKNARCKFGVLGICKICTSEGKRKKYAEDEIHRNQIKDKRQKAYEDDKECILARNRASYEKHREKRIDKAKEYYKENSTKIKNRNKERLDESREVQRKYRVANRQHVTRVNKLWRLANRDKLTANETRRKAWLRQALPKWHNDEWEAFVVQETYHLSKIRTEMLGIRFNVDHIVPLVSDHVCGLHCSANMQILERLANISKGNRYWPDMW